MIFQSTVLITTPQSVSQAVKLRCQTSLTPLHFPVVVALAGLKISNME
jgi:hypothetical protein